MQKVKKAMENQKRFVLGHGICHGAWSWYKVKTLLEAAGHCVSAIDLSASGINTTRVEEIQTLKDYSKPLLDIMDSFPSDKKTILVAHSLGGVPAALAADIFPCKTAAIVFLTSAMPDTKNPPAYVIEKLLASIPQEEFLDTVFGCYGAPDCPLETSLLGPTRFLTKKCYQLSPVEDLELAKMLNPLVTNNLAGTRSFSEEGYGSIPRIYIICEEDNIIPKEYQHWIISNFPPKEVIKIKDADHMPMNSKPQELCARLLKIAHTYA
ncbi:putative methylesterase 19 [Brassica rapa]|uniref:putative methylesterase 19 n=1 Tax=Brassica campestris TaxID=3711 RepID=UPI00142D3A1E|nr:putative methylesterase 19 [Brassica rapa]